jgi:hypothetical protein
MTSTRGGLQLLLQFRDDDPKLKEELGTRIDLFLKISEGLNRDFNVFHFDVRRLLQESLKDYLVIEDHVFKTIRKTEQAGSETHFVYVKSPELAIGYRLWLQDLFNNGDGPRNSTRYTERHKIGKLFDEVKFEVQAERSRLR